MKIKIRKNIFKYILIVGIALCGAFMFHVSPDDNMDFVRYQSILNSIRSSRINFWDFWINGTSVSRQVGAAQRYAFSENILIFLVAKFCTNDYILVWVSIFINYTCIAYIALDLKQNSKYSFMQTGVSILVCLAELPFIHACSGLRTATAACIMAVAIYLYLYKQSKIIPFMLLSILAVGFHPFVLFAIIIALAVRLIKNNAAIVGIIVGIMLIPQIAMWFIKSNIPFLVMLAQKYITYTSDNQFRAYRTFQYGTILICVLCILFFFVDSVLKYSIHITARSSSGDLKYIKMFFLAYSFIIIGNVNSYELVVRFGYLIGALSPVFSLLIFNSPCKKNNYIHFMIRSFIIILATIMTVTYIKYYYHWFIV